MRPDLRENMKEELAWGPVPQADGQKYGAESGEELFSPGFPGQLDSGAFPQEKEEGSAPLHLVV